LRSYPLIDKQNVFLANERVRNSNAEQVHKGSPSIMLHFLLCAEIIFARILVSQQGNKNYSSIQFMKQKNVPYIAVTVLSLSPSICFSDVYRRLQFTNERVGFMAARDLHLFISASHSCLTMSCD